MYGKYAPHPIRVWRESQQLSHRQAAELFGVDRATVLRWENGTKRIGPHILPLVAEKTGIAPARLRPDLAALFLSE